MDFTNTAEEFQNHCSSNKIDSILSELETHPFFTEKIDDDAAELPPFVEAIRQIKWDEDEPVNSRAEKFKEEGNFYLGLRKYRRAVIAYTVGIELAPSDNILLSKLYHNRAVAYIQNGNFRKAIDDFKSAINLDNYYLKAYQKASSCLNRLGKFEECKQMCLLGLKHFKDDSILLARLEEAKQGNCIFQRKERIERREILQLKIKADMLREVIKNLGIKLSLPNDEDLLELVDLCDNELSWRVCFIESDNRNRFTIARVPSTLKFNDQLLYLVKEDSGITLEKVKKSKIFGKSEFNNMISLDMDNDLLDYLTDDR